MHDMMPQDNPATTPDAGHDREGAMAKADLFKLANYSLKLFKQIQDDDQLEAWVQAKITKAADYVASVYHYLEYEMKFSQYGEKLNDAEMYSEEQKQAIKNKLMEAKEKIKELKKAQAEKVKEEADRPAAKKKETTWTDKSGKKHPATQVQGSKSVAADKEADKERKKHDKELDESEDRPAAKKKETTWTDKSGKKHPATRVQGSKSVAADKDADKERKKNDKELDEGKGDGNLANNAKPYDKVTRGDVIAGRLGKDEKGGKNKKVKEASHQEKTTMKHVKDPTPGEKKAAKDIKPGVKGYSDRVAMLKSAEKEGRLKESDKGDMDHDGIDEKDSKEYLDNKDAAIKKAMGKEKKVKESNFVPVKKDEKGPLQKVANTVKKIASGEKPTLPKDNGVKYEAQQVPQNPDGATAPPPKGKDGQYPIVTSGPHKGKRWSPQTPGPTNPAMKESLAESAEVLRIKELTQRLLG